MTKPNDERPAWMPKKWTNRNQVRATAVFRAISDLDKAIFALSKYEAKIVMAALDQHYVNVCDTDSVPPVYELSGLDTCRSIELIMEGPRSALYERHRIEIENRYDLEFVVRCRLENRRLRQG